MSIRHIAKQMVYPAGRVRANVSYCFSETFNMNGHCEFDQNIKSTIQLPLHL